MLLIWFIMNISGRNYHQVKMETVHSNLLLTKTAWRFLEVTLTTKKINVGKK